MAAKALNMISKLGNMKKKENDDIVFNRIFRSNNFLHQIADFIPNENNKDLYKRIIDRVKICTMLILMLKTQWISRL